MKSALKSFPKIFSFTFSQHTIKKSYRNLTLVIALICLILPAFIMPVVELSGDSDEVVADTCDADTINVVDISPNPLHDYSFLNALGVTGFTGFSYLSYEDDLEKAIDAAGNRTLILLVDKQDDNYGATVLLPESSDLDMFSGIFSLPTVIIAVLITLSGFLLYCSLSAVGGSLASKPEDLTSTNILFTLALILSFFITLNIGGTGSIVSTAQWLNYFPFTAILITPSRAILGEISFFSALASLAITVIFSIALMLLAGKVYTMMSFHKGNPPSIRRILKMLRSTQQSPRL